MENRDNSRKSDCASTIYVGELSSKTLDSDLFRIFSSIGEVVRIKLNKRAEPQSSFAFVTFANEDDAERAVKEYNQYNLHRKNIRVAHVFDDPKKKEEANVIVKNLPPNFTTRDLIDTFNMFGKIISAKIATYPCGKSKNYGFVQFDKKKSAKLAIKHCSGVKIDGSEVIVDLYNQSARKKIEDQQAPLATFTNCFIKNFPPTITEDDLRKLLEQYGTVTSLFFPLKEDNKNTKGFAFANFETPEQAISAIENLHDKSIFEEFHNEDAVLTNRFYIQKAQKKQEREEELRKSFEQMSMNGHSFKKNLYVTNIPKFIEKEELLNIFKEFGSIISISIGIDAVNDQKKYAYICYSTPDEAFIAIEKGNEIFIDGNKLHVVYFKNKSERIREKLTHNVGFNSSLPFIYNPSVKPSPNSSHTFDQSVFSGHESPISLQDQLHEFVLASANTFKHQWENLGVSSPEEFADKITKVLCTHPEDEIKRMINLNIILNQSIATTIEENEFSSETKIN
ncbi:Polyadenylate-binding protein, cytoplasmic and nuclear [Nosema bombycis CQ1]|uniref:Polyadenylate-binding protein, cytoplasmic and nuclear n=1 Tax=Nosema bombycis (strain CQ1 / CVCC 102059) TaxID=578461 RepID=R0KN86_NOSB1|nr:Polyadenylate-binding protein, cytoplasmic and nuclear [Nosema bombycis CQ1]|eukprot:EOB12126.1 Polyadenylate-binding protein, cytoplasmic and nuclear [Nosema bombycis CQ1]